MHLYFQDINFLFMKKYKNIDDRETNIKILLKFGGGTGVYNVDTSLYLFLSKISSFFL
jgi:hypothetical protein